MLLCCYFDIIFIFILLHCPLSGPDLIYISLLIIPCIIFYVTNKETLNLENETEVGILVNHNLTRADMSWLCGDLKIRRNLQGVWKRQCTPINMVMPFKIIKGIAGDIKEELK